MEITIPNDVCYIDKFVKEMKKVSRKNNSFISRLDNLVNAARIGRSRDALKLDMPKQCDGFVVIEDRSLKIKSGSRSPGGGFRVVYAKHNHRIFMLDIYYKGNDESLTTDERVAICKYVKTLKDGSWDGVFYHLAAPSFEALGKSKFI